MSSYEDETNMELLETKATSSKKDKNLVNYMHEMDLELAESTISKSFVTKSSDVSVNILNFCCLPKVTPHKFNLLFIL